MKLRKIQPTNCSVPGCEHAAWRTGYTCFRHTSPPRATLDRVYQAVRETPHASLREIGYRLKLAPSTVNRALYELDRVKAVRKPPHRIARALVVLPAAIYDGVPYRALWIDA